MDQKKNKKAEKPKFRSPENLQSQVGLRKLSEFETFSYSRWLMNVVVFIKGLRPDKLQLTARCVCKVQRVLGQPRIDAE